MAPPQIYYEGKLQLYNQQQIQLKRKLQWCSLSRLFAFVFFAVSLYEWGTLRAVWWVVATIFFLLAFLLLVIFYINMNKQLQWLVQLIYINVNELKTFKHQPNGFDDGTAFLEHDSYYTDLDIFGSFSLFHVLNRTCTSHGSFYLANKLKNPFIDAESIHTYQQAIRHLSPQVELRQAVLANGMLYGEKNGNLSTIREWVLNPPVLLQQKWITVVRWMLPIVNSGSVIFYLMSDNYLPLIMGVFASWSITAIHARYIFQQHQLLSKKEAVLQQYAGILHQFTKTLDKGSSLLRYLIDKASKATSSISALSVLANLLDQRLNMLVMLILNSLFLYDIQCMVALEKWKAKHSASFEGWIDCVAQIEFLNSMAGFCFNNPSFIFPSLLNGKASIKATGLAHPLIPVNERIPNDFQIGNVEQLQLITGSNMSGKTTFLRTVGINVVLASCGSPVCANEFLFTPMQVLTSIRVNDSLQEHTSYFMAELKQLKRIIIHLEGGEASLVLVDEILRGTNSEDKNQGSAAFIRKLLQYNCICLFASHDLSLGILQDKVPGQVKNYCFESTLVNGELLFDYQLRIGIAKNKNASFLMEKMGII